PEVLVAVDCGTTATAEVHHLTSLGIEVLVLDHHEPAATRPPCAIVNPKLGTRFHELCSAGVAFKVVHALLKLRPQPRPDLREFLDLVAIGTIADMVPLTGENRPLVRHGLARITRSRWPGIAALARLASIQATPRGSDIGFRMGPRINAAGRLATAAESLRLLLTDDPGEAAHLAQSLDRQNRQRQKIEQDVCAEAEEWVLKRFDPSTSATIVAGARHWHPGVLGIVASRLMRKHSRPTIIVGFDSDGRGHGSGRSLATFSLVEALRRCTDLLLAFGGHNMAAGLSIEESRFDSFRQRFEQIAIEAGGASLFTPRLELDADLDLEDLDDELLDAQDRLEPFGTGNSQPIFRARAIQPAAPPRILKDKHLRLEFRAGRRRIPAIFFQAAEFQLPRPPWDMAFRAERNTWNGVSNPQIHIIAIRSAR
ncbi:MAG: DHHA1 domain-containing protein, partial [Terrimicrobiaceae bacterium]|nr:DHHA1 domain-containing protein [Terrimicrobiaceae bacterium]